jgi:hypothetical protein
MPSSAKDRFTVDFEYVYFFVKSKKYFFEPIYEPVSEVTLQRDKYTRILKNDGPQAVRHDHETPSNPLGRNKRAVWTIPTQSFAEAHFATFPEKLVEPMILSGCPREVCKKCGQGRRKVYDAELVPTKKAAKTFVVDDRDATADNNDQGSNRQKDGHKPGWVNEHHFKGYTDCGCKAGWRPGIVLDPFVVRARLARSLPRTEETGLELNSNRNISRWQNAA